MVWVCRAINKFLLSVRHLFMTVKSVLFSTVNMCNFLLYYMRAFSGSCFLCMQVVSMLYCLPIACQLVEKQYL
jgi:hypothetical protein